MVQRRRLLTWMETEAESGTADGFCVFMDGRAPAFAKADAAKLRLVRRAFYLGIYESQGASFVLSTAFLCHPVQGCE
jgi:hypothetical protein